MKLEHIIEALRCCADKHTACADCPYEFIERCTQYLREDALAEITQLYNKIETINLNQAKIEFYEKVKSSLTACGAIQHCGHCKYSNLSPACHKTLYKDTILVLTDLQNALK